MNEALERSPVLVPYQRDHADGVVAVVRAVHDEYGFSWEADGYHADLYDVHATYIEPGGMFDVLLDGPRLVGTVGVARHDDVQCELHRMYLLAAYRGRRRGQRLLDAALDWARERSFRRMIAWSDVKLTDAHRLYLKNGFVRRGERICPDPDQSREYGFFKEPL